MDDTDLDEDIQVETNHYQQQQQQAASSDSNSSTITALECDSEEFLDEYIQEKHMRALLEERKKFSTFLKFPYSTRSRANRRIDSRAESSGANTPDPASPAPQTPSIGGDQEVSERFIVLIELCCVTDRSLVSVDSLANVSLDARPGISARKRNVVSR